MDIPQSKLDKLNELGQTRWTAIRRLSDACEACTQDNDLEEVIVYLAKIVIEKDKPFTKLHESLHDEFCSCSKEEEKEGEGV